MAQGTVGFVEGDHRCRYHLPSSASEAARGEGRPLVDVCGVSDGDQPWGVGELLLLLKEWSENKCLMFDIYQKASSLPLVLRLDCRPRKREDVRSDSRMNSLSLD